MESEEGSCSQKAERWDSDSGISGSRFFGGIVLILAFLSSLGVSLDVNFMGPPGKILTGNS